MTQESQRPSLLLSLFPVLFLMIFLGINVVVFKDDATGGPNQFALFLSGLVAAMIGRFKLGVGYDQVEKQIVHSTSMAIQACLILLTVGSLIGIWILSGVVPTMIYYGLKLINPTWFLPVACLTCAMVSLATGSSWSTTGTVGIALIGIGSTLGIPEGMVAGAIISGAYFGDKLSPLSDTTNLAPAMAGTDLFTHIRHMLYTTVPSILIAMTLFTIIGLFYQVPMINQAQIASTLEIMDRSFNINLLLFIAPAVVLFLVAKRIPALPSLFIGIFVGILLALIFQREALTLLAGGELTIQSAYQEILKVAYGGFEIESGNKLIDKLFSRGGMSSMLSTVWLIMMAMVFGGALEGTGMLQVIADSILKLVRGTGSLVGATLGSCLFLNMTASDQFLAIVVPGRMFRNAYEKYGLHPKNLSRALEDAGTVTSVLIPWNSGGAYNSGVLGVSTLTYAPYCFFNIASPLVSLFLASMGWTLEKAIQEKRGEA